MSRRHRNGGREEAAPPEPLTVPVVDSHCHVDMVLRGYRDEDEPPAPDDAEVGALLDAARAAGVRGVVQVGVDLPRSRWAAGLAALREDVVAAVALHPNEAGRGAATDEALREVESLAALPQVTAVGETGLDHFRTGPDGHRAQEESFRAHIAIAKRTGTALVIHDRDAHDDVVRVLRSEGAPEHVVFHCFSGGPDLARTCADEGWTMSFAGPVSYKANEELREAARLAPRELRLVETDAPFLAPVPHRGRPNSPGLLPATVRALADARGEDLDELCAAVAANSARVLGL